MKLTEAIDLFPTLRGVRAGVDSDSVRSWFYDADAFIDAARTHGSGATACACFVASCAGHSVPRFTLAALFDKIDAAHSSAAFALFGELITKGGLK